MAKTVHRTLSRGGRDERGYYGCDEDLGVGGSGGIWSPRYGWVQGIGGLRDGKFGGVRRSGDSGVLGGDALSMVGSRGSEV